MNQDANPPGQTDAEVPTSSRTPRTRSAPVLTFDLSREADRLRSESPWSRHGRNAVTLVKYSDLRIVYIVMKRAARMEEHHAGARISVHALSGCVRLHVAEKTVDLHAGNLLALERDIPHDLEAIEESTLLLTISWQGG